MQIHVQSGVFSMMDSRELGSPELPGGLGPPDDPQPRGKCSFRTISTALSALGVRLS